MSIDAWLYLANCNAMDDFTMMFPITDILAITVFFVCWAGYSHYVDTRAVAKRPVAVVMNDYRLRWMERMLERENRMPDVNITVAFVRSSIMFASTSILLIAGAVALLGQIESVRAILGELAYARPAPKALMEIQVFVLAGIFIYAFFTFVWAIRLFNNMLVLLGAAPQSTDCDEVIRREYPRHMALFAGRAFRFSNRGMRAYAFGLALLPWFVHPLMLIGSTLIVLTVLYRRDFRSVSLEVLEELRTHH
ncbi:DUF599 domain-containing protein [Rhodospirillales bacterium]|nr:DUF599 domain-containing protein [Rhodospirillales bacterium]